MTCIEKLRELHPEWDEDQIGAILIIACPEDLGIVKLGDGGQDLYGTCGWAGTCEECWNMEAEESKE